MKKAFLFVVCGLAGAFCFHWVAPHESVHQLTSIGGVGITSIMVAALLTATLGAWKLAK